MKSRFKMLSLATAVLFATSCNKDDNSDSIVDEVQQQEAVVVKERSVTVTGKVTTQKGLSKLSIGDASDGKRAVTFSSSDKMTFKCEDDESVHCVPEFNPTDGSFSLTIYFPAQEELVVYDDDGEGNPVFDEGNNPVTHTEVRDTDLSYLEGRTITLTIGTAPENAVTRAATTDERDMNIFETYTTTLSVSESNTLNPLGAITFEPQVAIIENTRDETIVILEGVVTTTIPSNQFAVVKKETTITIQTTDANFYFGSKDKEVEAKYYIIDSKTPKHSYTAD